MALIKIGPQGEVSIYRKLYWLLITDPGVKQVIPGLFFVFLCLFKKTLQFFKQTCEKCPSSIRRWDSNPRLSGHESPHITTRPWLPPNAFAKLAEWLLPTPETCISNPVLIIETHWLLKIKKINGLVANDFKVITAVRKDSGVLLFLSLIKRTRGMIHRKGHCLFCKNWVINVWVGSVVKCLGL